MKVVFLDIDGVLNTTEYRLHKLRNREYSVNIDPAKVAVLKTIVDSVDGRIVLISSWRRFWESGGRNTDEAGRTIDEALREYGLTIWDKTPVIEEGSRAQEVEQWLSGKHYVDEYVILDDKDFGWGAKLRQHWIQTDGQVGLMRDDAQTAIGILNGSLMIDMTLYEKKHRGSKASIQKLFSKFRAR